MTPEDIAISRASRAAQVLGDPLVVEVLAAMKTAISQAFFDTPAEAADVREGLHKMDRARQQFEGAFRSLIAGGEVEAHERQAEAMAARALEAIQEATRSR